MLFRLLLCLLALVPMSASLEGGIMDLISRAFSRETPLQPPSLRILLAHDEPSVFLEVKGKYQIFDPHTNAHIDSRFQGKRRVVEATEDGIRWGEEFPGIYQILIIPDSKETTIVVDGVEYRGKVYIYDVEGAISIVNQIDLEDYLSSVLPLRYPDPLPNVVLESIAIVSRTDTLYLAQSSKNPYWDVEAEKVGYHGYALSRTSKAMDKGLKDTQYIVLNQTGTSNWNETPFAVSWRPIGGGPLNKGTVYSNITIEEASKLSLKGATAVQILGKAFPNTSLRQTYEPSS